MKSILIKNITSETLFDIVYGLLIKAGYDWFGGSDITWLFKDYPKGIDIMARSDGNLFSANRHFYDSCSATADHIIDAPYQIGHLINLLEASPQITIKLGGRKYKVVVTSDKKLVRIGCSSVSKADVEAVWKALQ